MKLILKFKDGMSATQEYTDEEFKVVAMGNFIEPMLKGKENNGTITATDNETGIKVEKRYSDLYSVEIVFADV